MFRGALQKTSYVRIDTSGVLYDRHFPVFRAEESRQVPACQQHREAYGRQECNGQVCENFTEYTVL